MPSSRTASSPPLCRPAKASTMCRSSSRRISRTRESTEASTAAPERSIQ